MKLCLAAVLLAAALSFCDAGHWSVAINANNIAADSKLGMKLLSQSRRLEGEDEEEDDKDRDEEDSKDEEEENDREEENEEENNEEEHQEENEGNGYEAAQNWVAGFSLKFQGCHHIQQWNAEVDDENDVRIMSKRLARFRLCPTSSCSATSAAGCSSGYGDYIIDMDTYIYAYYQALQDNCDNYLANTCDCDGQEDADQCENDCFSAAGMYQCIGNDEGGINAGDYMACAGLEGYDDYFVGPYCSAQGGAIYLGMFTDDTCTEFADVTYKSVTGYDLPYESESVVDAECTSCADDQNGNEYTSEMCQTVYTLSGKCEQHLPSGTNDNVINTGCNYMSGIKIAREDGVIMRSKSHKSSAATAFIVIFALLFCIAAFYVWYLRRRLGVKKTSLL